MNDKFLGIVILVGFPCANVKTTTSFLQVHTQFFLEIFFNNHIETKLTHFITLNKAFIEVPLTAFDKGYEDHQVNSWQAAIVKVKLVDVSTTLIFKFAAVVHWTAFSRDSKLQSCCSFFLLRSDNETLYALKRVNYNSKFTMS